MSYEWDEEIPQPKPPTQRVRLLVEFGREGVPPIRQYRDATQADIARALGVQEIELAAWLSSRMQNKLTRGIFGTDHTNYLAQAQAMNQGLDRK